MSRQKNCLDCLHCKVSVKSTKYKRLCYCADKPKQERHKEFYWAVKKPCGEFEDMSA